MKGILPFGKSKRQTSDSKKTNRQNSSDANSDAGSASMASTVPESVRSQPSQGRATSPGSEKKKKGWLTGSGGRTEKVPTPPSSGKNLSVGKGEVQTGVLEAGTGAAGEGEHTFRVLVPRGVKPGDEFQVYAGARIVRVRCPPNCAPGSSLQITVPSDQLFGEEEPEPKSNLPPDSPNVSKIENNGHGPTAYMVTIPDGIVGGQQFPVTIQGQQLMVTCPANARGGSKVRIVPPPPPTDVPQQDNNPSPAPDQQQKPKTKKKASVDEDGEETQLFEVQVPSGVLPGKPFALMAAGVRILVTCPPNAKPGQKIRFKLPKALTKRKTPQSGAAAIRLSYDKDGWTRTIRVSDMKFQWVRMDDNGDVDTSTRFHHERSAYVRKLEFRPGPDERVRDGILSLVPATEAFADSKVRGNNGEIIATYSEIAEAQGKTFEDKAKWFQTKCLDLRVEWNEGHMRMNVRRECLLEDSVDAVMSLNRKDLRKLWRFEFIGEMGIDAGGLAREWFQLVTEEIFDPDMGLWMSSEANQMCMQVNPASKYICDDYLVYYRFFGRVMGKALFDGQLVAGHMVQYLYKHLLGWPITFKDIQSIDEEYYSNLKQIVDLAQSGEDISMILCMDFTTTQEVLGVKEVVELVENGKDKEVDNDNYPEYLEACLKYRMLDRVKPHLTELLLGFFDVIPEALLTVFDFQELELLMCGLPTIDMQDWIDNTEYSGDFEDTQGEAPACKWFWEVVSEFDQEMKARLLQFVTGTSGVPSRGFGVLQGNDGNIRRFTIHGVSISVCMYPRAHTCFNRIDLPRYPTKEELCEKLKLAVTMSGTGFDIE